jgi:hypothetical protein
MRVGTRCEAWWDCLSEKSPSRLNEAASAAVKYEHAMNKGINEARKIKYKCIQSNYICPPPAQSAFFIEKKAEARVEFERSPKQEAMMI